MEVVTSKALTNRLDYELLYLDSWGRLDAVGHRIGYILRSQHGHACGLLPGSGFENFSGHYTRTDALKYVHH